MQKEITINVPHTTPTNWEISNEINVWLDANLIITDYFYNGYAIRFMNAEDAIMFKLRFGV